MSYTYWTERETKLLRDNFGKVPVKVIADWLRRSPNNVRTKAEQLGLKRAKAVR